MCFNVESEPELDALSQVATAMGSRRRFHCGSIRMSMARHPCQDLNGRFGQQVRHPRSRMPGDAYAKALALPRASAPSVSTMHIGSQSTDLTPFDDAAGAAGGTRPRSDGERGTTCIKYRCLGGRGLCIPLIARATLRRREPKRFAQVIRKAMRKRLGLPAGLRDRAGMGSPAMPASSFPASIYVKGARGEAERSSSSSMRP